MPEHKISSCEHQLWLARSSMRDKLSAGGRSTDNDSYHYACAGKHVVRLDVHAWDKNVSLHTGLWPAVAPAQGPGPTS